jgi:hypothetical protein
VRTQFGTLRPNELAEMKRPKKRTPVPKKPPKVERSRKAYDRKRSRRALQRMLKNVDNER